MHATDIVGYSFNADTYCVDCIVSVVTNGTYPSGSFARSEVESKLDAIAQYDRIDRMDEHSFDSSEFPKVIFADSVHSGDSPDYCGKCHELLAPYECSLCGGEHAEAAHGEPLVMRDTGRDTITGFVDTALSDALAVIYADDNGRYVSAPLWNARQSLNRIGLSWRNSSDDERDEYATEVLDDIDTILSDAGYVVVTDGDMGTWSVYRPVSESATETVAR